MAQTDRNKHLYHFLLLTCVLGNSKAEEILQAYLQSSVVMAETILQRDQALTVKQKEIEGEIDPRTLCPIS